VVGVFLANAVIRNMAKDKLEKKVRGEISTALAAQVRDNAAETADRSAEGARTAVSTAVDELMARIDGELAQLRSQVEGALSTLGRGEDAVRDRLAELASWEQVLTVSSNAVADLIADVART
jgi:hypothetical protein